MPHYIVVSPKITEPVYVDGNLATYEDFCCVVSIEAENPQDAKSFALQSPEFSEWLMSCRDDETNPFAGLEVTKADLCEHGKCGCHEDCDDCINNWNESDIQMSEM